MYSNTNIADEISNDLQRALNEGRYQMNFACCRGWRFFSFRVFRFTDHNITPTGILNRLGKHPAFQFRLVIELPCLLLIAKYSDRISYITSTLILQNTVMALPKPGSDGHYNLSTKYPAQT
jgi:hypothetical protein